MKKATRRLLGAIFALVVAVAVSIGATFAWFTTSDTATISGISGQVTSGDASLEVKLVQKDGAALADESQPYADWGYSMDLTDLIASYTDFRFDALSWKEKESKGQLQLKNETAGSPVTLGVTEAGSASKANYIDFYLAVRSKEKLKIYLGKGSEVEAVGEENGSNGAARAWDELNDNYGATLGKGAVIKAEAQNAVRVGFDTVLDSITDDITNTGKPSKVWAPNEAQVDGANTATTNELDENAESPSEKRGKGYWKGCLAADYEKNVLGALDTETTYKDPAYTGVDDKGKGDETSLVIDLSTATDNSGYFIGYLHVYIWLEGTDGDCMNNIFDDKFSVNLVLESEKVGD